MEELPWPLLDLPFVTQEDSDITVGKTKCDNEDPDTVYCGVSCDRVSDADEKDLFRLLVEPQ